MNATRKAAATEEGQVVLETLQKAVKQTLEKKKRLGQYAVTWHDGKPVVSGEDAPKENETRAGKVG
jgi:hypothetical protein